MSDIADRLQALGLSLPPPPVPQGSYVPAVRAGNLVFVSGQLPMREGRLAFTGAVGKDLDVEQAQEAMRLCFLNALAALAYLGLSPDEVTHVIRLGGFVQSAEGFHDQPAVVNGASDLCRSLFGDKGLHARASVGVNSLPLNAAVELEAVFEVEGLSPPNEAWD